MVTYNTRQKQLILDFLCENKDKQLSCDEVVFYLMSKGTPVGKTTVYRQLERLSKDGIIRKMNSYKSRGFVYQFIDEHFDCDKHMHLRCSECGEYVHLSCDFMRKVSEHIFESHDFTVDNSHTEIVGVCGKCSSRSGGTN